MLIVVGKKKIATIDKLTVDQGSLISSPTAVVRYQYDNHLGSASLELDQNAAIISYEEYHPFGTTSYLKHNSNISQKRYKYVGKERDEETGLYNYGFRLYSAWLCRFVSVDPLQHKYPYYTPYQYAGNKPITFIDLDGLEEAKKDEEKPKQNNNSTTKYINPTSNKRFSTQEDPVYLQETEIKRESQKIIVTTTTFQEDKNVVKSKNSIILSSNVKQTDISSKSALVLNNAMNKIKDKNIVVSSGKRTPEDQARVMFESIEGTGENTGLKYNYKLYANAGDKVIDVYVAMKGEKDEKGVAYTTEKIKDSMTAKIKELGPTNVSKHCSTDSNYYVFDISPKSVSNGLLFNSALKSDKLIEKFFSPYTTPTDKAFHIQINN